LPCSKSRLFSRV